MSAIEKTRSVSYCTNSSFLTRRRMKHFVEYYHEDCLFLFIQTLFSFFDKLVTDTAGRSRVVLFLLLLICLQGKAQVKMPDMVTPADTWGIIDVNQLYGGCMQVLSYSDLLNTDVQFLKRGMLFIVYDYDGNNTNGLDTRAYMFLPASGTWFYNTPFEVPAADQGKTISTASLESALTPVSLGLSSAATKGELSYSLTDKKFYVYDGTSWSEVTTVPIITSDTSYPSDSKTGDIFYNTGDKEFYVYDGSSWAEISTGGSTPSGSANPAGANTGDVFYNTTNKKLYVYDGNSWVEISTGGSTPSGTTNPATASAGDVFYNTTDGKLYVYDGSKWIEISIGDSSGTANPATASAGDVFYNTSDSKFYVYNGSRWVEISVGGSTPSGTTNPTSANVGDVFYNTTDNTLYVYNGSTWQKVSAGDNLGNHTATEILKMGTYAISNDGGTDEGLTFDTDGNATFGQDVTVNGDFYTPSDERLKTNIETLTNVLEKIDHLRGVQFEYKNQKKYATGPKIGVIAQELLDTFPSMVSEGPDGYLKVDYTQLTGVLLQAIKEQQQEINELKNRINEMQKQINMLLQKTSNLK